MSRPTPAELRERRKALSLSQGDCAILSGVASRTWQRWEAGDQDIPLWTDPFLRCLEYEAGVKTPRSPPP